MTIRYRDFLSGKTLAMDTILCIILVAVFTTMGSCHPYFQKRIPNGDKVPSPCGTRTWQGVGHNNHLGGGPRNKFGLDFEANNFIWTSEICNLDSDGDGRTNGEELGDPKCEWTIGSLPDRETDLSHPGICEPLDSADCGGFDNSFVDCDKTFNCPVLDEDETKPYNVLLPEVEVPPVETTYFCMLFEFPTDQEYHLVATTPIIDNQDVTHHMLAYECTGQRYQQTYELNKVFPCGGQMHECQGMFGIWTVGVEGVCFPSQAGVLVGGDRGIVSGLLEIHYNNPEHVPNIVDSSGMTFHLTPVLRPYNGGVLSVGQNYLEIPPGKETHVQTGSCMPMCSKNMNEEIFVTNVGTHMHNLGSAAFSEVIRDGKHLTYLSKDDVYDYNTPVNHIHTEPVRIKAGDEIRITCIYSSLDRNTTTFWGEATADEMCYVFLGYYPKENFRLTCTQAMSIPECDLYDNIVNGCDLATALNPENQEFKRHLEEVSRRCRLDTCTVECLEYMNDTRQNPCYHGDVYRYVKQHLQKNGEPSQQILLHHQLMDSCQVQLAMATIAAKTDCQPNIAPPLVPSLFLLLSVIICFLLQL